MLFTIKRPKSQRFFQLSFRGFVPEGRTKPQQFLNSWKEFFFSLNHYFLRKIKRIFILGKKSLVWLITRPTWLKEFLIKKLIWSRGKLGRPVTTAVIMSAALVMFLFGEVFSGSNLVVEPEAKPDYIRTTTDIIPRKHVATTLVPEARKRTDSFVYAVEGGDTLSSIGEKFKISTDALKYVNGLSDYSILKPGQNLTIPPVSGLVHKVERGDTLSSIAEKYDVPPQTVADFNYILDTSRLAVGSELVIPGGKIPAPAIVVPTTPSISQYAQATPSKNFCVWPSTVRIITQYYSWYHNGIDIATPSGSGMPPLFACTSGRVVRAGWDPWGLGLHVRIDHGNGYETVYGHMSRIDVSYGQNVDRGQIIGLMGTTGRSTGPHVHFMVKFNGVAQNPLGYMN